jgi:hypothetical protein
MSRQLCVLAGKRHKPKMITDHGAFNSSTYGKENINRLFCDPMIVLISFLLEVFPAMKQVKISVSQPDEINLGCDDW